MPTRRAILRAGALGAFVASAPFFPWLARAEELEDRYFVFCYFNGGWDLLLSLDPRDPGVFREDLRKTTLIDPGFSYLSSSYPDDLVESSVPGMVFGPAIGGLVDHASKLCVVRGMSMDTLTHEVGRRRFITGRPPAGLQAVGSSLATVLAATLGSKEPIPQLSVLVESYNAGQPGWSSAIRVNSVDDLARGLRPSPHALSTTEQAHLDALMDTLAAKDTSPWREQAYAFRKGAQALVELGLDERFDFLADTAEMSQLRALYGIDDLVSAPAQAATAVTAITSGISRVVSIECGKGLDTHGPEWSSAHPRELQRGFDVLAAMLTDLESRAHPSGGTWLDRTTVIAFSEFGRTPLVNSSGGRDHFLHNACVLAGAGVQPGVVLGRSSDTGMNPLPVDLLTGQEDEAGEIVKPEHVFQALLRGVGVTEDIAGLGVDPLEALLT